MVLHKVPFSEYLQSRTRKLWHDKLQYEVKFINSNEKVHGLVLFQVTCVNKMTGRVTRNLIVWLEHLKHMVGHPSITKQGTTEHLSNLVRLLHLTPKPITWAHAKSYHYKPHSLSLISTKHPTRSTHYKAKCMPTFFKCYEKFSFIS